MRVLNKYIVYDFLVTFLLTVAIFTFIMCLGSVVRAMDLLARGVGGWFIFQVFSYNIPFLLTFSIPISVLTAILLQFGRMSFDVSENYPMLFLVKRLPRGIERLLLVGPGGAKEYVLEEKKTIKEGGKIEHVLYDKKDSGSGEQNRKGAQAWIADLANSLKAELKKKGLTPEKLFPLDEAEKARAFQEISKALCIRGMEKQEDVQGFLQFMMEN